MVTLEHPQGRVLIQELSNGRRRIEVSVKDPSIFVSSPRCETSYPISLIQKIMEIKTPAYLCDEIRRDEDPFYIAHHIETTLFTHVSSTAFKGKRLLDFGCGSGASTAILARLLPQTEIIGIELNPLHLEIAHLRAEHYRLKNIEFYQSPSGEELPSDIGVFDFIILPAVYEHLLPKERPRLIAQLWTILKKDGVLFIDETPHRWFPFETHTSNLPLINYLPDGISGWYARHFSSRDLESDTWQTMLRKGIRGGDQTEILALIHHIKGVPHLLPSIDLRLKDQIDIWFEGYAKAAKGFSGNVKRKLRLILKIFYKVTGIPLVPYISLAIQKKK